MYMLTLCLQIFTFIQAKLCSITNKNNIQYDNQSPNIQTSQLSLGHLFKKITVQTGFTTYGV